MFTITLESAVAMAAHFFAGQHVSLETTGLFTTGGLMGLWPGTWLAARIPGALLTRVLAVGILFLGVFIVVHSLTKKLTPEILRDSDYGGVFIFRFHESNPFKISNIQVTTTGSTPQSGLCLRG